MDVRKPLRDLVYGVSGSGKTSWWLRLAIFLHETRGLKTRWYLGDGGGQTIAVADVDDFLQIMPYNLWDHPLETMQKICEGYWPQDLGTPNSKLLPTSADEWAGIGLVIYEGLSAMADYIMGDRIGGLAQRMAKGEILNNDASFRLTDGSLTFGGNARTHYGFTQRRIMDLIERTRALPCHVGWTAHERKVEDDESKETWIGPDVSGRMLTTKIGAWFGNTIHLHPVKAAVKGVDPITKKNIDTLQIQRRAYTRTHYDPEAAHFVRFYANTRMPEALARLEPTFMPEWMDPDPIAYYARLQEATVRGRALVKETFAGVALSL